MGFLFWVACLWAAFIMGAIGNGFGIMGALFALPFGLGPVYAAYALAKASQARMNQYVSEFLTVLGHSNEKLFHLTKGNSIGVNPKTCRLVVGDGVLVKAYAFEDVRDWPTREKRASSTSRYINVLKNKSFPNEKALQKILESLFSFLTRTCREFQHTT